MSDQKCVRCRRMKPSAFHAKGHPGKCEDCVRELGREYCRGMSAMEYLWLRLNKKARLKNARGAK